MEELVAIYSKASAFTARHHGADLEALKARANNLLQDFASFYEEYCYVVVASGFKGAVAAKLARQLSRCQGDEQKCLTIFGNRQKIRAICKCYIQLSQTYGTASKQWATPQDLRALPYIGPVTCYHLARNIGLGSFVKPDLHLCRLVERLFGRGDEDYVIEKIQELAAKVNIANAGEVDFCLWVYLSHDGCEGACCGGGLSLR